MSNTWSTPEDSNRSAMTCVWALVAARSSVGASLTAVSTGVMPSSSRRGRTMSSIWAASPAPEKTPRDPSSSPASAMDRTASAPRAVLPSAENHGASARANRSGVCAGPTTAVWWVWTGHSTPSSRKKPTMAKTCSSSVSCTQAASADSVPDGLMGTTTGSRVRPLIPPEALMSSKRAW